MSKTWSSIEGPAGNLALHVSSVGPPGPEGHSPTGSDVLVLCHDFPSDRDAAARASLNMPALADRLGTDTRLTALTFCLRGMGPSSGDFSIGGWLEDLRFLSRHAQKVGGGGLWLIGFGAGGALSLRITADDPAIRGVACLAAPSSFAGWVDDANAMLEFSRRVGVIRSTGFPPDGRAWATEFTSLHPLQAAASVGPRPVLLVYGAEDEVVSLDDARSIAEAVGPTAELRILTGAGHRLRADPRAIALLIGWLERQSPLRHSG